MKAYVKPLLLVIIIAVSSLLLYFYFTRGSNDKQASQSPITTKASPGLPARLIIPAIDIDAVVEFVGVAVKGTMEVPSNTTDVGWFKLGPRPGEIGSAVIAGHVDGKNGKEAVFTNLYKLKVGDKLYVKDDKGITTTFIVWDSRTYNSGYAEEVFSSNDAAHLNLVTCDGVWNGTVKSYSKRLVVFADIAH